MGNMGFTLTTHYCAGKNVKSEITLLDTDLDCGMQNKQEPCDPSNSNNRVHEKDCCENDYIQLDSVEDFQVSIQKSNISLEFLISFIESYIVQLPQSVDTNFSYHPPPLHPNLDLRILFQSFTI
jgi:hypothetical protein